MQETAKKQKRITLKSVHQMLDGMSVELAEKVHLLFWPTISTTQTMNIVMRIRWRTIAGATETSLN